MTDGTVRDVRDLITQGVVEAPTQQYNQQDKERLGEAGTPITVSSVQYGTDEEYGAYWEFTAMVDGKRATFRLNGNEKHDDFITALASVTPQGPVGGLRLRAIKTRTGGKWLTITPVD